MLQQRPYRNLDVLDRLVRLSCADVRLSRTFFVHPVISRWHVVDPMSESFFGVSPYNYVLNDPINYTDPTGMYPPGAYGNHGAPGLDPDYRLEQLQQEGLRHGIPDWAWDIGGGIQDVLFQEQYGMSRLDAVERQMQYDTWRSALSALNIQWDPSTYYVKSRGVGLENFENGRMIYNFSIVKRDLPSSAELYGLSNNVLSITHRKNEDIINLKTPVAPGLLQDKLSIAKFTDVKTQVSSNPFFNVNMIYDSSGKKLQSAGISVLGGAYGVNLSASGILSQSTRLGSLSLSLGLGINEEGVTISGRGSINTGSYSASGVSVNYKAGMIGYAAIGTALSRGVLAPYALPVVLRYMF